MLLLLAAAGGVAATWWVNQPLGLAHVPVAVSIAPGTSAQGVAQAITQSGVRVSAVLLYAWFRISGDARQIKAGNYEVEQGATARSLLRKLVRGEEALLAFTLVEGWNFRQLREALSQAERLAAETAGLQDATIMEKLGRPGIHPEGRFFPETYSYAKGSTDLKVLERAMQAMDRQLRAAWDTRAPDSPLKNAEEALVLASIVEKETGRPGDRSKIAAVLANRLRLGMMLQTDPTVIYGLGREFDGNLRKKDLQTDTPWNTYMRAGLPPTPIAMPGKDALLAAVAPERSEALYFVARGDGSSQFSANLEEHNRAVDKYQRRQ